ncbi:MAG: hypothetical protein PVJ09_03010 [Candidatus Woesebacteria bacterium]|jgi:hypothetical protein
MNSYSTTIFEQQNPSKKGDRQKASQESSDYSAKPAKAEKIQSSPSRHSQAHHDSKAKTAVFSDLFLEYLDEFEDAINYEKRASISPIQVDELASRVAKLYERLRRIIDWKEEHLVRRTAIERILKRRLLTEISGIAITSGLDAEEMAEPLVLELIRSGYFSNGRISRRRIPEAKEALAKYIFVLNNSPVAKKQINVKEKINFYNWFLEIAACELEQILDPAFKENALLNLMTNAMYRRIQLIPKDAVDEQNKLIQTYIAVHRTLFNLDEPFIIFNLMKIKYPDWFTANSEYLEYFAKNIEKIRQDLENELINKQGRPFFSLCQVYDAAYLMIGDILKKLAKEPETIKEELADKKSLNSIIEKVYAKRLKTLKSRLMRSAIYSTLSIFLSGIVSYIIFEGPVAHLVHGKFSAFALFVDLAVPTAIMFILVMIIRPPSDENLARVKEEIYKIVYRQEQDDIYELSFKKKKKYFINTVFTLISLLAGTASLAGIWWIFKIAGVPWTSLYIDTISVAMIVFAAMIIKDRSKEITIQEKGSFGEFFVDLFTLPLAKIGQWFSSKWREYNVISVFFTALVDTPFSVLISTIEDWRSFLKEKRSEIH